MSEPILEAVDALYASYMKQAIGVLKNHKPGEGLFGIGKRPGDDPCHDAFAAALGKLLEDYAAEEPDSPEARAVLEYIFFRAPKEHPRPEMVYWMMIAVHGLTFDLIPRLERWDAETLAARYAEEYPRRTRFPAQKRVLSALEKQAKA